MKSIEAGDGVWPSAWRRRWRLDGRVANVAVGHVVAAAGSHFAIVWQMRTVVFRDLKGAKWCDIEVTEKNHSTTR